MGNDKHLLEAIQVVEQNGGMVMLPEKVEAKIETVKQKEIEKEAKIIQKEKDKFQTSKEQAKEEFAEMIEEGASYQDIEDMLLGYGLESDYMEEFIFDSF